MKTIIFTLINAGYNVINAIFIFKTERLLIIVGVCLPMRAGIILYMDYTIVNLFSYSVMLRATQT